VKYKFSQETLNEVRSTGELDFNIGDRQFVAIPFKNNYVIVASARNVYGKQELENLAYILIVGNLIGILVIYLAGRFFAKQALSPVSRMIKDVDSIGETNLSLRLDEGKKKDELSQLAMTFNRLFTRIEEAFERQKRFVSNASHELRTPLTTITGEIEVALMKGRTQEQYEEVLLSVLEEAKTLTKLSNDLLKLTQTGDIKGLIIHKIAVIDLLQAIAEECYKRYDKELLVFEWENSTIEAETYISGSLELLKIALVNIVDNAYKFSDRKKVELVLMQENNSIKIKIKDQGIGMTEEELQYIFQPFYRSNNVIAIPGSGIGLSLTQKIIKLHGGRIEIFSTPNLGTEMIVILPIEKEY
jgi:signal transduction histidine kinase